MKILRRLVPFLVVCAVFAGLLGGTPAAVAGNCPPDTSGVLPQNNGDGTLRGALNGTGSYGITDGPNAGAGFGPGFADPTFSLPSGWAYGPATVTLLPLYAVKSNPEDTSPREYDWGASDVGTSFQPVFVGSLSGGDVTGDKYSNLEVGLSSVTYVTTPANVPENGASGSVVDVSIDGAQGGPSFSADCLASVDEDLGVVWADSGHLGYLLTWDHWAHVDATVTLDFDKSFVGVGSYSITVTMVYNEFGVQKMNNAGTRISYDANDISKDVYIEAGGTRIFDEEDFWLAGANAVHSFTYPDFNPAWMSGNQLTLNYHLHTRIKAGTAGDHAIAHFKVNKISATITYDGAQAPSGLVLDRTDSTGTTNPPRADDPYTHWFCAGLKEGGSTLQFRWIGSVGIASLHFVVGYIRADAYYNFKNSGDGSPGIPASITELSLGGGTVPMAIAAFGRSASVTIPNLSSFVGYDRASGALSLAVGIVSTLYDGIAFKLVVDYSVGIPLTVKYFSGAGSATIMLEGTMAFSLRLMDGHLSGGPFVVSVGIRDDSLPLAPRNVFHTFQGYVGDLPTYNSTWEETITQAREAPDRPITIEIALDTAAPDISAWEMPPLPDPGADHVTFAEGMNMMFNLSVTIPSPSDFDRAFLAWSNASDEGNLTMEFDGVDAKLDILANQFYYGNYSFWMVVVSGSGNFAATPARTIWIVYEWTPPVVGILAPAVDAAFASPFNITASADDTNLDDTSVRVECLGSIFYMGKGVSWSSFYELSPVLGNWSEWEVFFAGLLEGSYNFTVLANDTRGNVGNDTVRFIVDHGAPTVTIRSPVNGSTYSTPPAIFVEMNDALSDLSLYYSINGANWTTFAEHFPAPNNLSAMMPADMFANNITEGPFSVAFLCVDGTGENFAVSVVYCRKDTSRPWVFVTNIAPGALLGKTLPAFNFTVMDDSPVQCTIVVSLGGWVVTAPVSTDAGTPSGVNSTTFSYAINASLWGFIQWEGPATLNISAVDAQGLVGHSAIPIEVDTIAPRVAILYPTDGIELMTAPSIRVSGEDANFLTAWYSLDAGTNRYSITGLPGTVNFACDVTAWDNAYAEKVYLLVTVEDDAGNVGFATITIIRGDFLEYGEGPNPWIFFTIFDQEWPVQVMFWGPVAIFAVYAIVVRRRKQTTAPKREVVL